MTALLTNAFLFICQSSAIVHSICNSFDSARCNLGHSYNVLKKRLKYENGKNRQRERERERERRERVEQQQNSWSDSQIMSLYPVPICEV